MEEIFRRVEEIGRRVLLIGIEVIIMYVGILKKAIREYRRVDLREKKEMKVRKLDGNNIYK